MPWSVNACGPAAKVAEQIEQQFAKIKVTDKREQETIQNARLLIYQTLATIDPEKPVKVFALGSLGYADYETKERMFQSVDLKIMPIHFSV